MNVGGGTRQQLLLQRLGDQPEARFAVELLTLGRRINHTYNELLAEHDLSGGRFAALLAVDSMPGITPAQLAGQLEVKRATVTGLIDGMVTRGLITRGADPSDRRVQTLATTESGKLLVTKLVPLVGEWLSTLASAAAPTDREIASRVLAAVAHNVDTSITNTRIGD